MIKRFIFDVETTGLNPEKNGIIQLACMLEINGKIVDKLNMKIKPFPQDEIDPEATAIHGLDGEGPDYMEPKEAYESLLFMLDSNINKYNSDDKAYMLGYNCQAFDKDFLYNFFKKNGSPYMFSYFYPETLDVFVLMGYACQGQRPKLGDSKLVTYAKAVGIEVDESKLHDANYDLDLTYELFNIFLREYPISE